MKKLTKKQLGNLEANREAFVERHGDLAYRRAIAAGALPPEVLKGFEKSLKKK